MKLKYICLIPLIGFMIYLGIAVVDTDYLGRELYKDGALFDMRWVGSFVLLHVISFGILLVLISGK